VQELVVNRHALPNLELPPAALAAGGFILPDRNAGLASRNIRWLRKLLGQQRAQHEVTHHTHTRIAGSWFFAAATPARADYAVIQYNDGFCRIWWNSADNPWGAGWAKVAVGLPGYEVARAALDSAIAQNVCH